MAFQAGLSAHDDTKHIGSAKRNTNDGVAGIDGSGNIIDVAGNTALTDDLLNAVNGVPQLDGSGRMEAAQLPTNIVYLETLTTTTGGTVSNSSYATDGDGDTAASINNPGSDSEITFDMGSVALWDLTTHFSEYISAANYVYLEKSDDDSSYDAVETFYNTGAVHHQHYNSYLFSGRYFRFRVPTTSNVDLYIYEVVVQTA